MAEPIVGFMVTIGFTGYMLEYLTLGSACAALACPVAKPDVGYHVAHKKEKIEAALKEYDAHHGHHH